MAGTQEDRNSGQQPCATTVLAHLGCAQIKARNRVKIVVD
jgi:hypothetical protein